MPDREKVMKGLECCSRGCKFGCPYADEESSTCESVLAADALELLKEQEPKKQENSGDNCWPMCGDIAEGG